MTRRQSIRQAVLLAIGMALGKLDSLQASGGELRVPLDSWQRIVFEYNGKRIAVSVADVFNSLEDTNGVHQKDRD